MTAPRPGNDRFTERARAFAEGTGLQLCVRHVGGARYARFRKNDSLGGWFFDVEDRWGQDDEDRPSGAVDGVFRRALEHAEQSRQRALRAAIEDHGRCPYCGSRKGGGR